MDLGLDGKIAVVFGASRGLGFATAKRLALEGCRVVITSRSQGNLDRAVAQLGAAEGCDVSGRRCDVSSQASMEEFLDAVGTEIGTVDIVVYNNGGPADSSFANATDEEFHEGYVSQVMGYLWAVRKVLPGMREKGWGRIVTLGSMAAKEPHRAMPLIIHNTLRPAALGLQKSLSDEFAKDGITFNTIGTGLIDGGDDNSFRRTVREQSVELGVAYEDLLASRLATVPAARGGHPDEVASLCVFLCSGQAGFMTGQLVLVDGGKVQALY